MRSRILFERFKARLKRAGRAGVGASPTVTLIRRNGTTFGSGDSDASDSGFVDLSVTCAKGYGYKVIDAPYFPLGPRDTKEKEGIRLN